MWKKFYFKPISSGYLLIIAIMALMILIIEQKEGQKMLSAVGKYQGYTQKGDNSSLRTSDLLTLSDGTRLAYDLILPTQKGLPADEPLPVLFKYTPICAPLPFSTRMGRISSPR